MTRIYNDIIADIDKKTTLEDLNQIITDIQEAGGVVSWHDLTLNFTQCYLNIIPPAEDQTEFIHFLEETPGLTIAWDDCISYEDGGSQ